MGTTSRTAAKNYMTAGMLEDDLRTIKTGLTALIRKIEAMDRRTRITNILSPRKGPTPCLVVEWGQCCLGRESKTLKLGKIAPALNSLALAMGRLARFVDEYTK